MFQKKVMALALAAATLLPAGVMAAGDGTKNKPLVVMMIPADTGTDDISKDYGSMFDGITKHYGIHFDIKVGDSYAAVVEGICNDKVDVAWFGAVTYGEAKAKCGVELLAVDVENGESSYYSGIFARKDAGLTSLKDLKGKAVAFGDPSSTSSFVFPMAMVLDAGLDPIKDFSKIVMTGSHSASLAALAEGKVDAAAASYNSYEKAVAKGSVDPSVIVPLVKSQSIPNPPMAMSKTLNSDTKAKLKTAFAEIHTKIDAAQVRGYGGKKVDGYDPNFDEQKIMDALAKLKRVTKELKAQVLEKAGQR